jgi:hypothetical protein
MAMKAIVWTDFNRWKAGKRKEGHFTENPLWIAYRMNLLRHYCCASVRRQVVAPLAHVILCNPQTRKTVMEYAKAFKVQPTLLFNKAEEVAFLKKVVLPSDQVAMIRLDSDDMYHPNAVKDFVSLGEQLLKRNERPRYSCFRLGYAYNYHTKEMRNYDTRCVGPFFCHYWHGYDLLTFGQIKDGLKHHQIKGAAKIGGRRFIVGMHDRNTSSGMRNKFTAELITGLQYKLVREIYGL